jgi:hypothetical protein
MWGSFAHLRAGPRHPLGAPASKCHQVRKSQWGNFEHLIQLPLRGASNSVICLRADVIQLIRSMP